MPADAERFRDEDVLVVGGERLASTMSQYLIDRIERSRRIEVLTGTEVIRLHGRGSRDGVTLRNSAGETMVPLRAVFVMIGAEPCTEAVSGVLGLDAAGYLLCGAGAAACSDGTTWPEADRPPHLLETVRPWRPGSRTPCSTPDRRRRPPPRGGSGQAPRRQAPQGVGRRVQRV